MPKPYSKAATGFIIFIAIVAWLALILELFINSNYPETNGLIPLVATLIFFNYLTAWTNLLAALCCSFTLWSPSFLAWRFFPKPSTLAAMALYICIVGVVYISILRFIRALTGLQKWIDEALHVAVSLLVALYWLFIVPERSLKWIHPFRWRI